MNTNVPYKGFRVCIVGCASALTLLPGIAFSQAAFFDPQEGVNIVSLGVGSAPDYVGSDDYTTVAAPMGRYYFSGKRYVQLLGPQISVNVLNDDVWQFGPQVLFHGKRDSDVNNAIVRQMTPIDSNTEGGFFVGASWKVGANPIERFGVRMDLQTSSKGTEGTLTANYFLPVSKAVVLNMGGGFGFTNAKWANTYFGVSAADAPLFNNMTYNPSGGVKDTRVNFGGSVFLSPQWNLMFGARYQRLSGDVADSPIVAQQGNSSQWIYGAAVGYIWQ